MSETIGRLLAVGNVAEVLEWGSRVLKLYKSTVAKPAAFREAAIHAATDAMDFPRPGSGACKRLRVGGDLCSTGWGKPRSPSKCRVI
jgi:hypothetical protein